MRRTDTLRVLIIDKSVLAQNMYQLLFGGQSAIKLEFGESADGLIERQRRARPHIVLVNSNAIEHSEQPEFFSHYPTVVLVSPNRVDLKELAQDCDLVTLLEKPFYPYELITVLNGVAAEHHPLQNNGGTSAKAKLGSSKGARA
jgi:hypothetical protein